MRNVEIAKAADQNAFKYVWCPQHHFLDEYSHMPGPEAFLGHCSGITERVHLGSAIFNITPAGEQAGAHRRERRPPRPPLEQPLRVRHRAGAAPPPRCTASTSPTSTRPRPCGGRPSRRSRRCGRSGTYAYEGTVLPGARARGVPEAVRPRPPGDVGGGGLAPHVRRGGRARAWAPSASPPAHRASSRSSCRATRRRSARPPPSATTSTTTSWASPTCSAWRTGRRPSRSPPTWA